MQFRPNPTFLKELGADVTLGRYLQDVAEGAAREVERRLPYPDILGGLTVDAALERFGGTYEGVVKVHGSGWHLWEYGTINHGARPAIRPGVQAALAAIGGRLGES